MFPQVLKESPSLVTVSFIEFKYSIAAYSIWDCFNSNEPFYLFIYIDQFDISHVTWKVLFCYQAKIRDINDINYSAIFLMYKK